MNLSHEHIKKGKHQIFTVSLIKDLISGVSQEEITYSRMVEIMNSLASDKIEAWERYFEDYKRWQNTKYEDDFARSMSEPNRPGYTQANND